MNAIIDTFKLEIIEIMFISDSYSQDKKIIEQLEDFYMNTLGTLRPTGYNVASGAAGLHVAEERGGHGTKEFVRTFDHLVSHGFELYKLADYFDMSISALSDRIKDTHQGRKFSEIQAELIGDKIKIITTLISIGIAHIDSGHSFMYSSYKPLADHIGLSYVQSLLNFVREKTSMFLANLNLELYLRPLAWFSIESSTDALSLLEDIGWGFGSGFQKLKPWQRTVRINEKIHKLFGTSYERAKIQSSSGFIGDLV
ncbi:MAG: hypothetical protein CEE43_15165 [Promethearchaeota archaeon Loki_b32]|nr:MAG: hypothetical protein CEE43_15165 [Candidatus Lokiarchaeota archaeon Loki_b32]